MADWASIRVPEGEWAAAVSGGADSVAMLLLCWGAVRHVVHLDHETRAGASGEDAAFVRALCRRLGVTCTVARRSELEPRLPGDVPTAVSARFRALRLMLYRDEVARLGLAGVLLAHHADDQAETVMQRLIRGSGFEGLGGMEPDATVGGVRLARPMLGVRKAELIAYLRATGQPWREDASNASPAYGRNRVRQALATTEGLTDAMLELASAARAYRDALAVAAPDPGETFPVGTFAVLPAPLARHAARAFLTRHVPADELTPAVVARFVDWAGDAAGPAKLQLPGGVTARRYRGVITVGDV